MRLQRKDLAIDGLYGLCSDPHCVCSVESAIWQEPVIAGRMAANYPGVSRDGS
jgi:hypothetical protein